MANLLSNTTIGGYQSIHTGNISSYAVTTGGSTMTGALAINSVAQAFTNITLRNTSSASSMPTHLYFYIEARYNSGTNGTNVYHWVRDSWEYNITNNYSDITLGATGSGSSYVKLFTVSTDSHVYATNSFRAPIFYDSADTSYYTDPNDVSQLHITKTALRAHKNMTGYGTGNWISDFSNTPVSSMTFGQDKFDGGPSGTWWFQVNMRHNNGSNLWGTQLAYGWEDNSNEIYQRNVTGGNWSGWVRYINSSNYAGILDARYYTESEVNSLLSAKQDSSTAITTSNIGSQTVASAGNVQGYSAYDLVVEARGMHSGSDFVNGTLVRTDINANGWAGNSFIMEVSGKSYGSGTPFKLAMEGYLYADTIINVSAMSYGSYFPGPVKVMRLDGILAFWWPRGSYWNSFQVHVRVAEGNSWNTVTSIADSVDPPSADKKISITPTQVIHTGNIGSQSVSYATTAGALSSMNISQFSNNSGYLTGITSGQVTGALGYTPYNSSNPSGYITGYTETDTLATVTARGATTNGAITVVGSLTVSSNNATGGGIILADDGDIVDLNDAYCSMRFSYGVRIFSANRGGSPVITLGSNGVVTATTFSGALSGNATSASTAYSLTSNGGLTTQFGDATIGYAYAIAYSQTGLFAASDNSNSILTVNRHPGDYYSQLGFSSNNNLYYRRFSATAINTSEAWQTIWTSSSLTNLNQLSNGPGYITSSALSPYLPLSGGILIEGNYFYFRSNRGAYLGGLDSPSLQAYSTGGNAAFMSFHRAGNYAVNFGLDADNIMRIGGWSASADRWVLDMSGNNTVAGSFRAPIFYDSQDTGYYVDPNSISNLNNLSIVGYQSIGGQTSNGQSNYQWGGATYQNPDQWTARLILRRDNASTGVNGSIPSLVIFNNNGGDQTTASMVFASNECVTGSNSVNLAGIVAKKESVGNCGGWSSGSLNFFVKNYGTRIDSLALTPDGNATFSGLVYSTGYGNSSQWNTAYGWGNHASAGYLTGAHNHDDRYYTESESDSRYLILGGSWGADLTSNGWTRKVGYAADGGEWVLLSSSGQISSLLDGSYFAGEQGGFYSMGSSNTYASRRGFYNDGTYANFNTPLKAASYVLNTGAFMEGYGSYSSKLGRVAMISFDWNSTYDEPYNHGIMSTSSDGSFSDNISINSFNDITLRLDANNNNTESYLRVMNNTPGTNTIAHIGYNGANGVASFSRDLYVNGGTGGNFGNRIVVGADSTPYTMQDANIRPTVYLTGAYPVMTLNHTETGNTSHGPTVQFTFNGLSQRQWVIGCGGAGEFMDFGFSNNAYGNSNYNPHNGIAGYQGNTIMRIIDNAVGIGGDWGVHGSGGNPAYTLDVRGTIYSNTDMRAPIFYDSQDTGYYLDPNSTSVLNGVGTHKIWNHNLGSTYYFAGGDWGLRHNTPSGWIQFGPANSSHAHIYTDRPNFYFNADLLVNGNSVITSANIGSQSVSYASTAGNASTVSSITSNTGLLRDRLAASANIDTVTSTNFRTTLFGSTTNGYQISTSRWNNTPGLLSGLNNYGTMLAWSGSDTHGFIAIDYSTASVKVGGGNSDNINWSKTLAFADGTGASGTWGINVTGSAGSASTAGNSATTSQRSFDYIYATSYLESAGAVYGTIFYDNNDRNYYVDPNSTSRLVTVNADLLRSYGNVYTDGNFGHGLVGLYSAERYQGVFAMGDSYKLAANGTSPGSLYGIAWTHTNVGGQSKSGLGHQALFMMNGQTYTAIGSGIWTDGTITTTSHGTSANWNTAFGWGNHASAGYQSASTAITTSNIGSQSVSNASTAGGLAVHSSRNNEANKIVRTDVNGYIQAGWINTPSGVFSSAITKIYCSDDDYVRFQTPATFISNLGLITTSNIGSQSVSYASSAGSVAWTNVSSRPTALSQFSNDLGNYGGWLTTGGKAADSELLDGIDSGYFVRGNGVNTLGFRTTSNSGANSAGGLSSGFYDGSGMSNMPTSDWYHLIVNAHNNSSTSNQYEFQLATAFWNKSDFFVRSISPGDVGPWRTLVHNGNIGSQSVNYANSAGSASTAGTATIASQLNKFGDIYGQDWNTYYVQDKLIAAAVYGHSGANRPNLTYDYGVALSYGESTGPRMQMYFPENSGNIGTIFRKATYRTGWNGNWSTWKTIVEQEGNTCTIVGGNGTGLEVHGNVGYNQDPLTYFLLRGQADTSWKALKVRLTGDAGGQDIEFRRIAENGADSRMWYVPRGGNTVNFDYPIVQPSDSRLKDNITPISTPVDKIKSLRGVEFDWNSGEQVGTHDVGLIAQDVEAVLPEAVTTQEDGYKNLAYTKVIPLLVEAMKEQQALIEALRAEVELLKKK